MITREQIVAEARTWREVRTFHRGRSRAGGVDCLGLVLCVGQAVGALSAGDIAVPDYGTLPNPRRLVAAMDAHAPRLAHPDSLAFAATPRQLVAGAAGPGDILGLSWGSAGNPMHLAILADYRGRSSIIHASPRDKAVKEVTLGGDLAAKVCAAWRFPNLVV
jgi:cell wall-associated NlpC family hydrolase